MSVLFKTGAKEKRMFYCNAHSGSGGSVMPLSLFHSTAKIENQQSFFNLLFDSVQLRTWLPFPIEIHQSPSSSPAPSSLYGDAAAEPAYMILTLRLNGPI